MTNANICSGILKYFVFLLFTILSGAGFSQEQCLPFFDENSDTVSLNIGGNVDITPHPPEVDFLGSEVNKICGYNGKQTSKAEFIQLMKDNESILDELMRFTDGKVFNDVPKTTNKDEYLESLSMAWYSANAFDHIFCGEIEDGKIGGLHYYGRYKQLQDSGEACRLPNYQQNEVIPGSTYSMGVRMKDNNGGWVSSDIKGYGLTLSALDILKAATRAFAENPTSDNNSKACLLDLKDGNVTYAAVFVRRKGGIRTFYPDATPDTQSCSKSTLDL